MCHHLLHKDFVEPVSHDDHQTIVVTAHVKDGVRRHVVGRIEEFPDMIEVREFDVLYHRVPFAQYIFCLRMLLSELAKHLDGNDVHARLYQFDIYWEGGLSWRCGSGSFQRETGGIQDQAKNGVS